MLEHQHDASAKNIIVQEGEPNQLFYDFYDFTMILNPYYFALAFGIGMLVVYISTPPPTVVIKFPSPYNAGKVVYTDKAGECYVYKSETHSCPRDQSNVKPQPIQEDFKAPPPKRAPRQN